MLGDAAAIGGTHGSHQRVRASVGRAHRLALRDEIMLAEVSRAPTHVDGEPEAT
jgi:hypothetical protein